MKTGSLAAISLALSFGWLAFLSWCLFSGQTPENLRAWLRVSPLILSVALGVRPQMSPPLMLFVWGAAAVSALASAAIYVRLLRPDRQGPFLTQLGMFAIFLTMVLVSRWAYLKWPATTSRRARTGVAAAFIAFMGIGVAGFAAFALMSNGFDWHGFIDHWDITLVVLYLPLMLVAGLAYASWRSGKSAER